MKITKIEMACLCVTLTLVGFVCGYYLRGASIRDAIIVETEKTVETTEVSAVSADMTPEKAKISAVSVKPQTEEKSAAETEENSLTESTAEVVSAESEEMSETEGTDASSGLVNINTADAEELETLPGVGPVIAERIIAFREEYGPFSSADEIMLVSGIGEKTYQKLVNLITVED